MKIVSKHDNLLPAGFFNNVLSNGFLPLEIQRCHGIVKKNSGTVIVQGDFGEKICQGYSALLSFA